MPCDLCTALNGTLSSSTEPHSNLKLKDKRSWGSLSAGMAKGHLENYECTTCGTAWDRDNDPDDKFARWSVNERH